MQHPCQTLWDRDDDSVQSLSFCVCHHPFCTGHILPAKCLLYMVYFLLHFVLLATILSKISVIFYAFLSRQQTDRKQRKLHRQIATFTSGIKNATWHWQWVHLVISEIWIIIQSDFWSSPDRQTESDSYTVQHQISCTQILPWWSRNHC